MRNDAVDLDRPFIWPSPAGTRSGVSGGDHHGCLLISCHGLMALESWVLGGEMNDDGRELSQILIVSVMRMGRRKLT
jgi:hypothetical protein